MVPFHRWTKGSCGRTNLPPLNFTSTDQPCRSEAGDEVSGNQLGCVLRSEAFSLILCGLSRCVGIIMYRSQRFDRGIDVGLAPGRTREPVTINGLAGNEMAQLRVEVLQRSAETRCDDIRRRQISARVAM
jgi:hypothetical protein